MADVVYSMHSESGEYRAEVIRHSDHVFRVELYRMKSDYVPGYGNVEAYWSRVTVGATYGDSLERATQLAAEELRLAVELGR